MRKLSSILLLLLSNGIIVGGNLSSPAPVIEELKIFNKVVRVGDSSEILSEPIEYTESIELKSMQNSFTIEFGTSNPSSEEDTFAYMLEGFDHEWIYTSGHRVSYTNLAPGEYRFLLRAASAAGVWGEQTTSLEIRVLPKWYRTTLSIGLFALLVIGVIIFFLRLLSIRNKMRSNLELERRDKQRQAELHQMKIQFYINMSHELRTPLTLILAPLQELISRARDSWSLEQFSYINKNAKRLNHIVNQLMDYRRAELGVFSLRVKRENLYEKTLQNFLYYDKYAQKREIDYNLYSDIQNELVLFDSNYIDLIINNLLSNAFKFTKNGDRIYIKLNRLSDSIVLEVSDTGVGIPKSQQEKIFDRFSQFSSEHQGSGVGISLVQRLVELHHGTIRLESEQDKGTSFFITIPQDESLYSAEELAADSTEELPDSDNQYTINSREMHLENIEYCLEDEESKLKDEQGKRGTILIVDDSTDIRHFIAKGLNDTYNIIEASNGAEALEIVNSRPIDLVLTDAVMPIMGGIELCRRIKQNAKTYHIPIYIISAKGEQSDHIEGLKAGADDYISKPFSMTRLASKIQNTLRTRRRAFENYSNSMSINPKNITSNIQEEEWLNRAIQVVNDNIDNVEFSTEDFATEMNVSRSNLHLKLKAITGQGAVDFIHKVRFGRACELLLEGRYSVSEISYMVGYNTPSYFASRFKKYLGCSPSEYVKKFNVSSD